MWDISLLLYIKKKKKYNGNANLEIDCLINEVIEKSKETNFSINYCAIDGDSHYSHFLKSQIDNIIQLIYDFKYLGMLNEEISKLPYIFISDPLHIWKNQKSHVLDNKVVVNPHIKSRYVTGLNINNVLGLIGLFAMFFLIYIVQYMLYSMSMKI